jgi:hypothetical protein
VAITAAELQLLLTAKNEMSKVLGDVQKDMGKAKKSGLNLGNVFKGIGIAAGIGAGAIVGVGGALAVAPLPSLPLTRRLLPACGLHSRA